MPGSLCCIEDQTNLVHFGQGVCILLGDVARYLESNDSVESGENDVEAVGLWVRKRIFE